MKIMRVLGLLAVMVMGPLAIEASGVSAQEPADIEVTIDNHAFLDVHVYVIQSGQRRSLGLVSGLSRQTFDLPRTVAESDRDYQILANPIGARRSYLTDVIVSDPGDHVVVTLENNLNLSSVVIQNQERPESEDEPQPTQST